jgi:hypothetical protein
MGVVLSFQDLLDMVELCDQAGVILGEGLVCGGPFLQLVLQRDRVPFEPFDVVELLAGPLVELRNPLLALAGELLHAWQLFQLLREFLLAHVLVRQGFLHLLELPEQVFTLLFHGVQALQQGC